MLKDLEKKVGEIDTLTSEVMDVVRVLNKKNNERTIKSCLVSVGLGFLTLILVVIGIWIAYIILENQKFARATQTAFVQTVSNITSSTSKAFQDKASTAYYREANSLSATATANYLEVYVSAGEFEMGSDDGDNDEKPIHNVYLDAYWIDRYEVTNAQYSKCVNEGKCQPSDYENDSAFNGSNQPVVGVDWNDANRYCTWAGRRLPTEAEWEKAARGTDGNIYPWGNQLPSAELLNWCGVEDGYEYTSPVGIFEKGASPFGVMDMSGNVWEWTADWSRDYPYENQEDQLSGDDFRVVRGGSWGDGNYYYLRTTHRYDAYPNFKNKYIGFRCASSYPP